MSTIWHVYPMSSMDDQLIFHVKKDRKMADMGEKIDKRDKRKFERISSNLCLEAVLKMVVNNVYDDRWALTLPHSVLNGRSQLYKKPPFHLYHHTNGLD